MRRAYGASGRRSRIRVEAKSPPAHVCAAMAILHPLRMVCLALAFLVGVTAQFVPCGTAVSGTGIQADMSGGCSGSNPPCGSHMPDCAGHAGCIALPALPVSPTSVAVVFGWRSLDYDRAPEALSGISVKPELSPPIFAA